ncbi:acetyl/propionyl/methylcrotonyl-CoA carboxylase subunit alpha [Actinomadura alba]|uniref:biotin carboxylase n=1 Tax=Actinomadura alba TaxID=406431 RepID=A0ABR7LXK9_9ACTN|nr:biotin carboxylase N-terminal domain-containing protein [Actinomadura alba]MBC6469595.1 ATP-grasp domain-containing protein [Actinomadura alba]
MFETVLVANRGEIAVRIIRTLRTLGITSVAVHTDADAGARHVRDADVAVRIESYLSIDAVLAAARETGAEAVHPGYGFLAENAAFARACADAGVVFVGPPAEAIEAMGDKIRAKRTVAAAGVPVVPGSEEPGLSDEELIAAATSIGMPVLLKPSAGGGGKGMRLVRDPAGLAEAIASARREALGSFGDDTLLVERFVENPRHIEIQIFADAHGGAVHLGERECSLQRRHQKIIEEAPSPLLDATLRASMGAAAVAAAKAVGYVGAGTVEFVVAGDRPEDRNFMEMNTRLQVEHPVTELVTGYDLVELQLRVAAGEPLPFTQDDIALEGHAVEARIYAEDPSRGFLPTGGRVLSLSEPAGAGVRVDSGIAAGDVVGSSYDPMLAKVIARGADRQAALRGLDRALASYTLLGVPTNVGFLRALLSHPDVAAGRLDTGLVERALPDLTGDLDGPGDEVLAAAALERMLALEPDRPGNPWEIPDGWRAGGPAWTRWLITAGGRDPVEVRVRGRAADAEVRVGAAGPVRARARWDDRGRLVATYAGRTTAYAFARDGDVRWLGRDGRAWALTEHTAAEAIGTAGPAASGLVRSPMPGTVLAVKAAEGDTVTEGQPLVIVEAMKMEHTVVAPVDGLVARLPARPGAQVALDETLAEIVSAPEAPEAPAAPDAPDAADAAGAVPGAPEV